MRESFFLLFWVLSGMMFLVRSSDLRGQNVPSDNQSLETAQGSGMAMYAEVNGYPGPKHVLDLQEKLNLTDEQLKDIESIHDEMREQAVAKGQTIIKVEQSLNDLFATGKASEERVKSLSTTIGRLRGELRAIHLVAHMQAREILSKEQIAAYNRLRRRADAGNHGSR
ncbi:MAG: Spy/CpxP family protein refolding chaperone [Ignavibacteriae bacterium]|nr:Spy/CpxP family protein refolding chaperone [Ignavibacteriota bacterium]